MVLIEESGGRERSQRKVRQVTWPRRKEIVSVDYILSEGQKFGKKLKAEGLLEGYSCFQVFKHILMFLILLAAFHYVTE